MSRIPAHKLGYILQGMRTMHGLTVDEVAEKTGIPRSSITGYENDRVMLPLDRAIELMGYYGYEITFRKKGGKADARESE